MDAEPVTPCFRIQRCRVSSCAICVFTFSFFAGSLFLLWPGPAAGATERLVIDTDAGIDDALAILAMLGDVRYGHLIEGITCVRGTTEERNVATNVLNILKIADRLEVPVYPGAEHPLIGTIPVGGIYGSDGLGDVKFPDAPSRQLLQNAHAAVYLATIVQEYPGEVTLLLLGPMTNVALAMRLNTKFMRQVKRIIALGGDVKASGSYRPNVDFNFYMDPDAATILFQAASKFKRKITLVSLESITENLIDIDWRISTLGAMNSTKIEFLNKMEKSLLTKSKHYWNAGGLYAASVMIRPESITESRELYVDVENEGRLTRGVIVIDYKNVLKQPPNADIIFGIDRSVVMNIALQNFK